MIGLSLSSNVIPVGQRRPSLTASSRLSGRDLTIRVDSLAGVPIPVASLTKLALDGADMLGMATENGDGSWTYTVPDSGAAQTVAWEVTATNVKGSGTASGIETVAPAAVAPTILTAPAFSSAAPVSGSTVTIAEGSYSGTPAPTIVGTLTLAGVDVSANMAGSTYTIPGNTADGTVLVWTETAGNGAGSDATQKATATVAAARITATEIPAIGPARDGDRLSDTLPASATDMANYSSTGGAVSSAVAAWSIDGGAWDATGSRLLNEGETLSARVTVTDETGNSTIFDAGKTTVEARMVWLIAGAVIQSSPLSPAAPGVAGSLIS